MTITDLGFRLEFCATYVHSKQEELESYPLLPIGTLVHWEATLIEGSEWPLLRTYGPTPYECVAEMEELLQKQNHPEALEFIGGLLDECRTRSQVHSGKY